MKSLWKTSVAVAALTGIALLGAAPAQAGVHIGIGIGVPGVNVRVGVPGYYYGPGYYPPGPCDAYDSYYDGDCGYAVYTGRVFVNGVWIDGPHYYRWVDGAPLFWYRGGWYGWNGWTGVNFGWNHSEGWGWHGGHWDRGWGEAHGGWHGRVLVRDRGGRGDHGDHDHH